MLLHQVALMLRGKVITPVAGELKLLTVLDGFLQDVNTLGIGQTHEGILQHTLQTSNQCLVNHLVEESKIILTVLQCPTDAIFDKVLLEVHQLILVHEGNLRLHHPELSEVTGSIRVLGTERRTEGIDSAQCRSTQLALQLSGYRQRSLLAEEVIVIDNLTILVLLQVIQVLGGHLEHITGTLTVTGSDQRGMEIEEAMLMEIGMDSHRHVMTDTHHGTKGIGTETHMSILTHHLKRLSLLLHGIGIVASTIEFQACCLYLTGLSGTLALHQGSHSTNAGTCGHLFQQFLIKLAWVYNHLHVLDGRAIIQGDEVYSLRTAMRAHPSFYTYLFSKIRTFQYVNYLCSFH